MAGRPSFDSTFVKSPNFGGAFTDAHTFGTTPRKKTKKKKGTKGRRKKKKMKPPGYLG